MEVTVATVFSIPLTSHAHVTPTSITMRVRRDLKDRLVEVLFMTRPLVVMAVASFGFLQLKLSTLLSH